jgi:hypothetical protein
LGLISDKFAAYLETSVPHKYVDGGRSSFFTATLETCGNSSFIPAQVNQRNVHVCIIETGAC